MNEPIEQRYALLYMELMNMRAGLDLLEFGDLV